MSFITKIRTNLYVAAQTNLAIAEPDLYIFDNMTDPSMLSSLFRNTIINEV